MRNCPPKWAWSRSPDVFNVWQISVYISKTVQDTLYSYNGRLIGNHIWSYEMAPTSVTLKVSHSLRRFFKCAIPRSFVLRFTRFQMTRCVARSLSDSWASCFMDDHSMQRHCSVVHGITQRLCCLVLVASYRKRGERAPTLKESGAKSATQHCLVEMLWDVANMIWLFEYLRFHRRDWKHWIFWRGRSPRPKCQWNRRWWRLSGTYR